MRAHELYEEERMKMDSPEFKKLLTPALLKLGKLYAKHGKDLRIVGGAVRDLVLGKEPKDIDLASDATPAQSITILMGVDIETTEKWFDVFADSPNDLGDAVQMLGTHNGIHIVPTGLQHGTITAIVDGEEFEITTLRIDTEHTGRHATVQYTKDWEQDAERRDLTFNAMSLDLDGTLYDYHGGLEDLKASKAKFVGDASSRMTEDYLRILRYFRFQGRTAKPSFDADTLEAIRKNASGLKQISGERIWMEMQKILEGDHTIELLKRMVETGVDEAIGLPMGNLKELTRAKKHIQAAPALLVALLKNEADVNNLTAKWKLSAIEREIMRFIVVNRDKPFNLDVATRLWTDPKVNDLHVRILAYYLGDHAIANELKNKDKPVFPVSGKDLIQSGIKPGPEMGKILKNLEQKWKDDGYKMSKEDLLKWSKVV